MATFRKRKSRWQVQVRHQGRALSRTFAQKSDAIRWAKQTEAELDRIGLPSDIGILKRLNLNQLLAKYSEQVLPRKRGGKNEAIIIEAFRKTSLASTRLSELRAEHFSDYRDIRLKKVKPATINRELGIVQHALETAKKEWGLPISSNPLKAIFKPKADQARQRRILGRHRNSDYRRMRRHRSTRPSKRQLVSD
jgi:hypothetical protein